MVRWERALPRGTTFDFLIHALKQVAGAQPDAMGRIEVEHGQALVEIVLHPGGEPGGGVFELGAASRNGKNRTLRPVARSQRPELASTSMPVAVSDQPSRSY